jgi:hypothetical protein
VKRRYRVVWRCSFQVIIWLTNRWRVCNTALPCSDLRVREREAAFVDYLVEELVLDYAEQIAAAHVSYVKRRVAEHLHLYLQMLLARENLSLVTTRRAKRIYQRVAHSV